MDGHDGLVVALTPLIDVLERLGVAWYVGGSVASTVHGRFRATNDVDVIADLREEHASPLRAALEAEHYIDEQAICDAVRHERSRSSQGFLNPLQSRLPAALVRGRDAFQEIQSEWVVSVVAVAPEFTHHVRHDVQIAHRPEKTRQGPELLVLADLLQVSLGQALGVLIQGEPVSAGWHARHVAM